MVRATLLRAAATRTYNDAITALNTLQSSHATILARKSANIKPNRNSNLEILTYLRCLGHTPADFSRLNIVHVAGTKGKGSTCAYVASMLAKYKETHGVPQKTGLLTSPHLISVRERIRLDLKPISEQLFTKYFFDVWDRLGDAKGQISADNAAASGVRPNYARYLTLLAYHVFLCENVSAAVFETGIGGEYDATNIAPVPAATGISFLGIDHVYVLGNTVEKIAWHKGGIMKTGTPAFSVPQVPGAADVLRQRADEKKVELMFVREDDRLGGVAIRPDAEFQRLNASLAVRLAETVLERMVPDFAVGAQLSPELKEGLESVVWRGRCEVKKEEKIIWHLDGAHTIDSINVCATWFVNECRKRLGGPKVLIFNQQGRTEAVDFLNAVHRITTTSGAHFDHVIFCTNVLRNPDKKDLINHQVDPELIKALTVQNIFATRWRKLDPGAAVSVVPTVDEALEKARELVLELPEEHYVQVLVTGSLHLVGAVLSTMEGGDANV